METNRKNTIGNVVIETLTYRPVDGRLVVATHGNGIYQTTLNNVNNVLAIENLDKERLADFRFPNPASDELFINLKSNEPQTVSLTIIDELGKKVMETKEIKSTSGEIKISENISQLSPGIYFAILKNESEKFQTIYKEIIIIFTKNYI